MHLQDLASPLFLSWLSSQLSALRSNSDYQLDLLGRCHWDHRPHHPLPHPLPPPNLSLSRNHHLLVVFADAANISISLALNAASVILPPRQD